VEPSPLEQLARELRQLQTAFVIIGGLATAVYSPGRLTEDLDILVSTSTAREVRAELERLGAKWLGPLSIGGATYELPSGLTLDVVESAAPWVAAALGSPHRGPSGYPIVALPYLVVLKLDAGRDRDLADIAQMLGRASEQELTTVRQVVAKHLASQVADLESLIQLGQLETGTMPPHSTQERAAERPAPERKQQPDHGGRGRS
jgi:hypothetical protein